MSDDPRASLDAIAGASLARPAGHYAVEGLSFGDARLDRETAGSGRLVALVLALTPEAAQEAAATGSDARTVSFPAGGRVGVAVGLAEGDAAAGLRALLLDHGLLSRAALLRAGSAEDVPAGTAAAKSLTALAQSLDALTGVSRYGAGAEECGACRDLRLAALRARVEADVASLQAALAAARSKSEAQRMRQEIAWKQNTLTNPYAVLGGPRIQVCPHAAMRREALRALGARFPELTFELAGVLRPAVALDPPRFVLEPDLFKAALGHWLMGRARSRYGGWDEGSYWRRQRMRRSSSAARGRARDALTLPPEQRAGVAFAASAWGIDGDIEGLGWVADAARDDGAITMDERPAVEERRSVPAVLPEGFVAAPKPSAAKAVEASAQPAGPTKKTAKEKTAKEKTAKEAATKGGDEPRAETAPEGEFTAAELRAMGHSAADLKRMLKEGTIVRASFGWYRFARS